MFGCHHCGGADKFFGIYLYFILSLFDLLYFSHFLGGALASFYGVNDRFIWPDNVWLQQYSLQIFVNLSLCLSLVFTYFLLQIWLYSKWVGRVLISTAALLLLNLVIGLFLPPAHQMLSVVLPFVLTSTLIVFTGIGLWLKDVVMAQSYTLAWCLFIVCSFLFGMQQLGLWSAPQSTLLLGAVLKIGWITLTLVVSYHRQKQELLTKKIDYLENDKISFLEEIQALSSTDEATEALEYKMQERTLELEVALRELSDRNRELEEKNTLDGLTGMRNRSYFDKKLVAEVRRSRREQTQLSVVMLDIDYFKKVNDNYGHLIGDECIKAVAQQIQAALKRPSDEACRFGGEEFALILPNTELQGAIAVVENIRINIENTPIQVGEVSINITISAGIGCAVADLSMPEDAILALADQQLYKAKNAGRNQVLASSTIEQDT
ncbi:diguanylate cyclase [Paraglaciecola aquimarina]|uniref:diguanylate cyclase n=1 Tax=Paraglaciecola aquimarina TaxID=1235557 RepID=A0ABU3SSG2_9ALTE|nr:diguanylate cyclase [Paraglaciecola aquimarina]MDU0352954.1 diguanylate cyclase [Paraglaciecola aquimarina]